MQKELKTALEVLDLFPSSERFILPVRIDDCEVGERKLREHHWVDLFPESEYLNRLKKILQAVSPWTFLLRSKQIVISYQEAIEIIRHGFYKKLRNPAGKRFSHKYKVHEINNNKIIFDEISCLMWQQSRSQKEITFEAAKKYITELNRMHFASFADWRLPTLEEAMSLMEPEKKNGLYISLMFDSEQDCIWTADQVHGGSRASMGGGKWRWNFLTKYICNARAKQCIIDQFLYY